MTDQVRVNFGVGLIALGLFSLFIFPSMPIMAMIKINWQWLPYSSIIAVLGGLYLLIIGFRAQSSRASG